MNKCSTFSMHFNFKMLDWHFSIHIFYFLDAWLYFFKHLYNIYSNTWLTFFKYMIKFWHHYFNTRSTFFLNTFNSFQIVDKPFSNTCSTFLFKCLINNSLYLTTKLHHFFNTWSTFFVYTFNNFQNYVKYTFVIYSEYLEA